MCEKLNCAICRYWNTDIKNCIPLGCVEYEYYKCGHCIHRTVEGETEMCTLKNKPVGEVYGCDSFEGM